MTLGGVIRHAAPRLTAILLRMRSWRVFSGVGRCGYLILAALSIPSQIRHGTAAMYASERIAPQAQSMLLKCYTNSLSPSEPN